MKNNIEKMNSNKMSSERKTARNAGIFFLILAIGTGYSWSYFNSIFVPGDAIATVNNIQASGHMFRYAIMLDLMGEISFIFLIYYLYELFKSVNKEWARIMALLVVISIPIAILNLVNLFAPLLLLDGRYVSAFGTTNLNAMIMLFRELYEFGVNIAQVFWGLWLLPLAYLTYKSGFVPKFISVFLTIAGLGYVVGSLLKFMSFDLGFDLSSYTFIGEVMMIIWLLIAGFKKNGGQQPV